MKNLCSYYYVKPNTFGKMYKKKISDFKDWEAREHAEDYLVFPNNISQHIGLDEVSLSKGELYTIGTNKSAKGKKRYNCSDYKRHAQ